MFYHFLYPLRDEWFAFNIFKYITVRMIGASVTAFLIALLIAPVIIRWLRAQKITTETKRQHAERIHSLYENKSEVPTMGGILILGSLLVSNLLWGNFNNEFLIVVLLVTLGFGVIGCVDDWLKLRSKSSRGLSSLVKFSGQLAIGISLGAYLYAKNSFPPVLLVPFVKDVAIPLGLWFIPFTVLVLVGTSNALNLTDGLDGLATGCLAFAAGAFSIISYVVGRADFAQYLSVSFVPGAGELAVFCASLVGAAVGFLWYNSYPATVMMGDVGSLPLGGALGAVAILIKNELALIIIGGIFVWEALSVILQVSSFKLFGKRVFLMAPYHHHLQLKGWSESKVTIRLWIVAFILALIGLGTLKLR